MTNILHKQRQRVTRLEATATGQRAPEPPWRFEKILIRYRFTGRDLDPAAVQRAIGFSETKYCSIYATLRDVVELHSEFEIVQEG
ncbi:MAG: hypothetical protein C4342_01275 [Armatimonadota bacterium]